MPAYADAPRYASASAPPCRCCRRSGITRLADINTAPAHATPNPLCEGCALDPAIKIADCQHGRRSSSDDSEAVSQ